jgi:LCP family protein required for cell wall assembly
VPESPPTAPPPVFERADIRKKTRKRVTQRLLRVAIVVTVAVVVLVGAGIGYATYRNHQISHIVVNGLRVTPPSGIENILLVGSTSRCALKQQNPIYGLCSEGVTGVNSDVVMLLHLDPTTKSASILSIPRDLFVPNARTTGPNKIDAALYQGPQQLVRAIEDDLGIPVQHYVELNFDSFAGVVQALGGIDMYFPEPVYDAYSQLDIPTAGCHHLTGFEALAVVRARHLQYKAPGVTSKNPGSWPHDPQSDLSRIRRDHEFLRVLATTVSKRGLDNPVTDNDILGAVAPQLQVDSALGLGSMLGLVLTFHGVDPETSPQLTLPVMVDSLDYYYQGYDYGSAVLGNEPGDTQVVDRFLGIKAGTDPLTGKQLPAPKTVQVSVLNGTGESGQAATTASALQALGFTVTGTGDAPAGGSVSETMVYYSSPGEQPAAEAVVHALSGAVAVGRGTTTDGAGVTVVTGSNFAVDAPAPGSSASPGSSTGSLGTGPVPSGAGSGGTGVSGSPSGSSELAAATAPTQPLAPFDPRSCTASGGEGP